jgi:signal peptidase
MSRAITSAVLLVVLCVTIAGVVLSSDAVPYRVYAVRSDSMYPAIPSKSAVIVREGAYRVGQAITFHTADGVVTHRLMSRNPDGTLQTKGDANETADPGSVSPRSVVGGVVAAPRMLGYWLVYFKSPLGLGSLVLALVCLWLVHSIASDFAEPAQARDEIASAGRRAGGLS